MAKKSEHPFGKVILGGWGFGRSEHAWKLRNEQAAENSLLGEYLKKTTGCYFHHRASDGRLSWGLPPFFRTLNGDIDLLPFLLYDTVVMDQEIFEILVNGNQLLEASRACRFYLNEELRLGKLASDLNSQLLVELKEKGLLTLVDFSSHVLQAGDLLPKIAQLDMNDNNMSYANFQSMQIWKGFLERCNPSADLRIIVDTSLSLLDEAIRFQDAKLAGMLDNPGVGRYFGGREDAHSYLVESLDDVNSTMLISQIMRIPIYDWADHMPFYRNKFARTFQGVDEHIEVIKKLFQTFVPQFNVKSIDEILEIKRDKRFESLRDLIQRSTLDDITTDMVADALSDVAKLQKKLLRFGKIISWLTIPISFIPVANVFVEKATTEIAEHVYSRVTERGYEWQCLFADLREKYSLDEAILELDAKKGGGGRSIFYLMNKDEIRDLKNRMDEARGEQNFLRRRIKQLQYDVEALQEDIVQEEVKENGSEYRGHLYTKRFHKPDCRYVKSTAKDHFIKLPSIQFAFKKGYYPCKYCVQGLDGIFQKKTQR